MNTRLAIILYIGATTLANLTVAQWGPSVAIINAFFLIGLDFFLRDHLHERWVGNKLMLRIGALIAVSGVLSYVLNPASAHIAVASVAAFCASMAVDTLVYHLLIKRGVFVKQNGSNLAGALTDSLVFSTLAFGGFLPGIVLKQFGAKVLGGLFWSFIYEKARTVSLRAN